MKNIYLITENSFDFYYLPYLWCSMKTYYEDNGQYPDQWQWHDPNIGEWTDSDIFDYLEKNQPDVFGFSVYVWNEERFDVLALKIKQKYPKCLIVYGGPQQNAKHNIDFFRDKFWVDITLPGDAYGEIVLSSILDNFPIEDFDTIPYIYYPDSSRNRCISSNVIEKRSFRWPSNMFKRQEQFIIEEIKKQRTLGRYIISIYETSRGCPYKCIFCEWGGGINTKVVKKPYAEILDDIEWLSSVANIDQISFADGNFGMTKIDIDINKFLIDCKNKYGYPTSADYDFAKNNYKNVLQIKDMSIGAGLLDYIAIAIQTFNDEARKNIERIDIPFSIQLEGIKYLKSKHGDIPLFFETILGLPGETLESYCEQIDIMFNYGIDIGGIKPVPWILLPEAPAFDPNMREKFKIKTIKKHIDLNSKLKENNSKIILRNLKKQWKNSSSETVVSTLSYSEYDWIKMRRFKSFVWAGEFVGINQYLIRYMFDQHKIKPSEIYYSITNFAYSKSFKSSILNTYFGNDDKQSQKWMFDPLENNSVQDFGECWDVIIPQHQQIRFIILTNVQEFFTDIGLMLYQKYKDINILDLCTWIKNILLDFSIDYRHSRRFTSQVDWQNYFRSDSKRLDYGKFCYEISTDAILSKFYETPNWHELGTNIEHAHYLYHQKMDRIRDYKFVFSNYDKIKCV